jgi:hypothetical protein
MKILAPSSDRRIPASGSPDGQSPQELDRLGHAQNSPATQHGAVNTSNAFEVQISLFADIRDHQAELVRMPDDRDLRRCSDVQFRENAAVCVALDCVSKLPGVRRP